MLFRRSFLTRRKKNAQPQSVKWLRTPRQPWYAFTTSSKLVQSCSQHTSVRGCINASYVFHFF